MTPDLVSYVHRLAKAWNSHELEQVLPYYSEEYEGLDIGEARSQRGREAVKQMLRRYWDAFPDLQFIVESTLADGCRVAIAWLATGTQQGMIMNIPPTGRKVEIRGISIIEVRDGLVARGEYIWDLAGMLRHMGLLPNL